MEEIIKSIRAHLYERVASPLFGTFTLSWALWNYRFVVTLLSPMDAHEKFDYISTFLYPSPEACIYTGFIYPLLTTLAFIFVYPFPAKYVYSFVRNRQKELKEIKQKIEDETPLTQEESRKLRREMARLEVVSEKEVDRLRGEIERLKAVITEFEKNTPPGPQNEYGEPQKDIRVPGEKIIGDLGQLTEGQFECLKLIAEHEDNGLTYDRLADEVERSSTGLYKPDRTKLKFDLGELQNRNLVTYGPVTLNGHRTYAVTHEGRALLVRREEEVK